MVTRMSKKDRSNSAARNSSTGSRRSAAEVVTEVEIEGIRTAYRDGCTGDVLMGLRGTDRVITMSVPRDRIAQTSAERLEAAKAQLLRIQCDGYVHVSRSRAEGENADGSAVEIVIAMSRHGTKRRRAIKL